ncbi:MAG: hypothetical protein VB049_04995 [Candidatus Pelethousia sp.]|nr:hypothetical protein [Candidatus Pelethousia sp.]
MPFVNNVESLRAWFDTCPHLKADKPLTVDYTGGEPVEYSIFSVPSEIKYKANVLGEEIPQEIQTLDYIFASIENYGKNRANVDNLGFYQKVADWIMEQSATRNLPAIDGGVITSIKPTLTAYVNQAGASSARYQINIKITYRRL